MRHRLGLLLWNAPAASNLLSSSFTSALMRSPAMKKWPAALEALGKRRLRPFTVVDKKCIYKGSFSYVGLHRWRHLSAPIASFFPVAEMPGPLIITKLLNCGYNASGDAESSQKFRALSCVDHLGHFLAASVFKATKPPPTFTSIFLPVLQTAAN
jgi:hypothetical protein